MNRLGHSVAVGVGVGVGVAVGVIARVGVAALGSGNEAVAVITPVNDRRTASFTFTISFPFRSAATITAAPTARATITAKITAIGVGVCDGGAGAVRCLAVHLITDAGGVLRAARERP